MITSELRQLPNNVATEMSSTNPPHSHSSFSRFPGQDSLGKPANSHGHDEDSGRPDQHIDPDHQHQAQASTNDKASDEQEQADPANDPPAQRNEGESFSFQPFFTLIEDAHTAEFHHPTVHYIFSDDDTDIVTEAALRSLEAQQEAHTPAKQDQIPRRGGAEVEEKSILLPPSIPGVRENYIVLDVAPVPASTTTTTPSPDSLKPSDSNAAQTSSPSPATQQPQPQAQATSKTATPTQAFRVTSAKSFSPTWQVLSSEMVPAPTFENGNPGDTPGHGLMLKIHGTGGVPSDTAKEQGERGAQRLEEMMDQFTKRMRELQMVIDAARTGDEEERSSKDQTGDNDLEERKEDDSGKDVHEY